MPNKPSIEIEVGKTYESPHTGARRTVLAIIDGDVYYRVDALSTRPPHIYAVGDRAKCTKSFFRTWLKGVISRRAAG